MRQLIFAVIPIADPQNDLAKEVSGEGDQEAYLLAFGALDFFGLCPCKRGESHVETLIYEFRAGRGY